MQELKKREGEKKRKKKKKGKKNYWGQREERGYLNTLFHYMPDLVFLGITNHDHGSLLHLKVLVDHLYIRAQVTFPSPSSPAYFFLL